MWTRLPNEFLDGNPKKLHILCLVCVLPAPDLRTIMDDFLPGVPGTEAKLNEYLLQPS